MKQRILSFLFIFGMLGVLVFVQSCGKDELESTDLELYNMALETDGFVWFNNSDALLPKSSGTGHSHDYLRTRYNAIAASVLDSNGRILEMASFPEGSLIVKELFKTQDNLDRYAILYKKSDHIDADQNGWVWGYVNSDQSVAFAAARKGSSCINCHSQTGSIDYMLMNKFFP
jgi:hypothetical protein